MLALCPICSDEFYGLEDLCPTCGCGLVPSAIESIEARNTLRQESGPVKFTELCRPKLYPLAMLIKQTLEQNGIRVVVNGASSLSVLPHLAFSGELRVMVPTNQLDFAQELYHAYFEGDKDEDFEDDDE
jgi:hypothetical protein